MAAHIGIVACSAEGAALCYRTICKQAAHQMGEHCHPEITMHTHPLSEYMAHIRTDNWKGVAQLMLSSADKLAAAGAEFAICPDNTIHQAFEMVAPQSPIPWLHIAGTVAEQAKRCGYKRLGILGTKYLMTGPVYPQALQIHNIACHIPDENIRAQIDEIIFTELVNSIFREQSRHYFKQVIEQLKDQGCDAVVLGCTEIPLIVDPKDSPLPTLDSTRLLARAALTKALKKNQ
ncbi:MAG: amino acid racemase [Planctomycetota bacterium]|nr:MAG: amino acid racemase [Planctomycetota bacterium]